MMITIINDLILNLLSVFANIWRVIANDGQRLGRRNVKTLMYVRLVGLLMLNLKVIKRKKIF